MTAVYVLDKNGKPLMPTTRCGHVRILLKQGKARVVERKPFTIQLTYDTPGGVQPLVLGIDPGRTNIGLAVLKEDGVAVFAGQVETRNKDIPKLMKKRKAFRQQHRKFKRRDKRRRRARKAGTVKAAAFPRLLPGYEKPVVCHDIKNKEARFNNRKRPKGWLTPTANHLLQTHLNIVNRLQKLMPISKVVLEVNKFAFMQLDNPNIQRWEYQCGPLWGTLGLHDAVFQMQSGHCLLCQKGIDCYSHIVPPNKNGSETLANVAGLCAKHHTLVHTDAAWEAKLAKKKAGMNKKYHALSVLNQIIPFLGDALGDSYPGAFFATNGASTAAYRKAYGIPKDHYLDAACIAASVLDAPAVVEVPLQVVRQFRRHDRRACHKANGSRVYLSNGKAVATNRHKAFEQKDDSLAEYRATHSEQEVSALVVKEHRPQYKDMKRNMPGSIFCVDGRCHTMQRIGGSHNGVVDYYHDTADRRFPGKRCVFIQRNRGLAFL